MRSWWSGLPGALSGETRRPCRERHMPVCIHIQTYTLYAYATNATHVQAHISTQIHTCNTSASTYGHIHIHTHVDQRIADLVVRTLLCLKRAWKELATYTNKLAHVHKRTCIYTQCTCIHKHMHMLTPIYTYTYKKHIDTHTNARSHTLKRPGHSGLP